MVGPGGLYEEIPVTYLDNINVGTATVSAEYGGGDNYLPSVGSSTFVIEKIDPICSVDSYNVPYNGSPHTATGSCVGILGEDLSSGLNLSGTTHTDAGDYPSDPWTFSDNAGNYKDASGTVHDVIQKIEATCSVVGWTGPYDGDPHGASGSCSGLDGELSGLDLGASFTDVPGGTANWTLTGETNYNDQIQ